VQRLNHLQPGLALVLVFVGTKMLLADLYPIPIAVLLGAVATLLGVSVLASLLWPPVAAQPVAAEEKAGDVLLRVGAASPDGTSY